MITAMPRIAIAIHDFPKCLATFRDVLGMSVVDLSESSVASLGAKVAMCVPEVGVYSDGATMFAYPAMNGDKLSLSTSTLMIDGFPLAAARLMAGRISSGSVTFSP